MLLINVSAHTLHARVIYYAYARRHAEHCKHRRARISRTTDHVGISVLTNCNARMHQRACAHADVRAAHARHAYTHERTPIHTHMLSHAHVRAHQHTHASCRGTRKLTMHTVGSFVCRCGYIMRACSAFMRYHMCLSVCPTHTHTPAHVRAHVGIRTQARVRGPCFHTSVLFHSVCYSCARPLAGQSILSSF